MMIYFVRHGETEWNKKEILQGHKDSPSTIKGINNAEKLGKILRDKKIEIIYSSDLGRCVQTAEIINRWLKVKIIKTKELRERNFGDLNGSLLNKKFKKVLIVTHDGPVRAMLSEYYNANFNSKKCDTSVGIIYSIEVNNNKMKNINFIK